MKKSTQITVTGLLLITIFFANTIKGFSQSQSLSVPEKATDVSPLLIGEKVPDLPIENVDGKEESLPSVASLKPSLLIFYRGGWCPYCNVHLAEIQKIEKEIIGLGYQIIAISPDSPENLKASVDKHSLDYELYSDSKMKLAEAMGIAFKVPEGALERVKNSSGGNNPGWLPVPSVFVLDTNGQIQFEHINPDYKTRITGNLLLAVLKELKKDLQ